MERRHLITLIAVGSAGMALPNVALALDPNTLAQRMQGFYDKTKTFQSGFKQRFWVEAHRKVINSNGAVAFSKPGKMSWRYKNNGNRVVSDGKTIKVYEADSKQMYLQDVGASQYPAALSFLIGGGKLAETFRLKMLDAKSMGFEGGHVMMGVPKQPTPAYQKVFFYIDGSTYQVRRVLLLDAQRNRNRFDFVTPVINKDVPKQEFDFQPPPGTRIIKP